MISKSAQAYWLLLHQVHQTQFQWFPRDEYSAENNIQFGYNYYRTNAFNFTETKDVYCLPYLNAIK